MSLSRDLATAHEMSEAIQTSGPDGQGEMVDGPSDAAVQRIRRSLYHVHLPKLVDANLLSYDRDEAVISLVAPEERMEEILTIIGVQKESTIEE